MGRISKFLPWRENFGLEHDASGLESLPPGNFTHFCRPMVENYESVFLTVVRPKSMFGRFDHRATIILSRYFLPMVRLMGVKQKFFISRFSIPKYCSMIFFNTSIVP